MSQDKQLLELKSLFQKCKDEFQDIYQSKSNAKPINNKFKELGQAIFAELTNCISINEEAEISEISSLSADVKSSENDILEKINHLNDMRADILELLNDSFSLRISKETENVHFSIDASLESSLKTPTMKDLIRLEKMINSLCKEIEFLYENIPKRIESFNSLSKRIKEYGNSNTVSGNSKIPSTPKSALKGLRFSIRNDITIEKNSVTPISTPGMKRRSKRKR